MTSLSGIRAITFDVDGTLQDFDGMMRHALGEVLKELARLDAEAAQALDVERMIAIRDEVHERLRGRVTDLNAVREESIKEAIREAGRPDEELGSHLAQVYFRSRDGARALFPDVRPALELLGKSYRLGLLSNGNSYAGDLGIGDLISFEVFSQDNLGIEKPDPRIFDIAVDASGFEPHQLLHVGDSIENDVAGASNAGVAAVWLNRSGSVHRSDITVISTLSSLPILLDQGPVDIATGTPR